MSRVGEAMRRTGGEGEWDQLRCIIWGMKVAARGTEV